MRTTLRGTRTSATCSSPFEGGGRGPRSRSRPPGLRGLSCPPLRPSPTRDTGSSAPFPLAPPPEARRREPRGGAAGRAGACARARNVTGGAGGGLEPRRPGERHASDPFFPRPSASSPLRIRFPSGAGAAASTRGRCREAPGRGGGARLSRSGGGRHHSVGGRAARLGAACSLRRGGHGLSARRVRGGVGVGVSPGAGLRSPAPTSAGLNLDPEA